VAVLLHVTSGSVDDVMFSRNVGPMARHVSTAARGYSVTAETTALILTNFAQR